MKQARQRMAIFKMVFTTLAFSGCGYHMRGEERPFFKLHHLQNLYVYPVRNNSYKAGVEITVYNALRKRFSQGGYVKIVDKPDRADAFIEATVNEAAYAPLEGAIMTADKLPYVGTNPGPSSVLIAPSYQVKLKVQFVLSDQMKKSLWSDSVSKSKIFAASNYMGTLGSTTALINEGEFERTLTELSIGIAIDAEESINTLF